MYTPYLNRIEIQNVSVSGIFLGESLNKICPTETLNYAV